MNKNRILKIRALRQLLNIQQKEMAHVVGIEQANYSLFEKGKTNSKKQEEYELKLVEHMLPALRKKVELARMDLRVLENLEREFTELYIGEENPQK